MAITGDCGPHCGIRSNAEGTTRKEGHCPCPGCLCPQAAAGAVPVKMTGVPMCSRWYERSGGMKPWERGRL